MIWLDMREGRVRMLHVCTLCSECRGCGCYLYMITTCLHVVYVPLYMLNVDVL